MPSHQHQPARLTKKQKKATAFRERGHKPKGIRTLGEGKGKGKGEKYLSTGDNGEGDRDDDNGDEDANAVPAMEDQDQALAAMAGDTEEGAQGDGGRAVRSTKDAVGSMEARKKMGDKDRKRSRGRTEPGDGDGEAQPAAKKAKLARGSGKIPPPVAHEDEDEGAGMGVIKDGDGGHKSGKDKEHNTQRYILFIGNLKYTTTREAIQNHFSPCDPPPTVRLLTPKTARAGATISKSKGCAFLEFSTRPALQAALRLHQSELDGRRINVELTVGGGGKGDARLTKVKARNKLLMEQRAAKLQGKDIAEQETLQPQRFSTTSGVGDVPRTKRTWSVGDGDQSGEHHGRTKRGTKRGTRTKNWGTGVNALPVG